MIPSFPFSALVGQDDLKLALLLTTIDPTIGGVLIRGERGTAKSTAARGLAALLPPLDANVPAPFVELPLGATEDRVVGSLDVELALREGRPRLRSGLLARAHGGVLYVDEVNLLPDHLVDLLLDAAASGRVTIERDGVSASEPARFVLLGSMNPEEGELRPQFIDRFGLSVDVHAPDETAMRVATVQARLAFDADPEGFLAAHDAAQRTLRERIAAARARLSSVALSASLLGQASALCAQLHIDGLRGDIVLAKTARALAAWEGADAANEEHLRRAAQFALRHRRRRKPFDTVPSSSVPNPTRGDKPDAERRADDTEVVPPSHEHLSSGGTGSVRSAPPASVKPFGIELPKTTQAHATGRRDVADGAPGAVMRPVPLHHGGPLAVAPTMVAAAARGATLADGHLDLNASDLRTHERRGRGATRVLLVVDTSGSMAAQRRLALAKGAAIGLLTGSYQRRDEVGLLLAGGDRAELRLPFTRRVEQVEQALREVPTGGRTPLAHALASARAACAGDTGVWLVLLSDGRANVALHGGDPWQEALAEARLLAQAAAGALVIDCENGPVRIGRARELAAALGGAVVSLDDIDEEQLTVRLRRSLEGA